jgi:hypothetical protein
MVVVTASQGLCKVGGIGRTIQSSSFGTEIHDEFDQLEEALEKRYGKHKAFDFLRAGSIWDDSQDWMMSLAKKERRLAAFWGSEWGSSTPQGLQAIALQAHALGPSRGYVNLAYEFENFDKCNTESRAVRDEGL